MSDAWKHLDEKSLNILLQILKNLVINLNDEWRRKRDALRMKQKEEELRRIGETFINDLTIKREFTRKFLENMESDYAKSMLVEQELQLKIERLDYKFELQLKMKKERKRP